MQEAEDQDTCRICSAPAEEGQPLFHPCKCSGTIRYIHQDCLTTWLAHSKKKHCDVCKYAYSFTKVYASDMPARLPFILVIKRVVQQILLGFVFLLRGGLVATIWLGVLPWVTVWTFRMYFSFGDTTAWWIANQPRPDNLKTSSILRKSSAAAQAANGLIGKLTAHPLWVELSADIFMGQIIASLIVLSFVAVFLLREWISQNARPGVFDDEEPLPPQQPAVPQGMPDPVVVVAQPPPADHHQLRQALARRQVETMRVLDAMRARDGVNGHIVGDSKAHGRSPLDRRRKKSKAKHVVDPNDEADLGPPKGAVESREYDDDESHQKRSFSRRILTARLAGARRKAALAAAGSGLPVPDFPGPMPVHPNFEFTFHPPFELAAGSLTSIDDDTDVESLSAFPQVSLEPPRASIPFSFDPVQSSQPAPETESLSPASPVEDFEYQEDDRELGQSTSVSSVDLTKIPNQHFSLGSFPQTEGDVNLSNSYDFHFLEDGEEALDVEDMGRVESSERDVKSEVDKYFPLQPVDGYDHHRELGGVKLEVYAQDEPGEDSDSTGVPGEEPGQAIEHGDSEDEEENEDEDDRDDALNNGPIDDLFGDVDQEDDADDWENLDVQIENVAPQIDAPAGGNIQGAPVQNQAVGMVAPPAVDRNDELEANVEDDMEGALEAIGMRGPIYGVLQNAVLIIFLLDTAIFVAIFVPFTLGKITALLLLDPPRFLQILHLPIRAIRIVTDPVVDSIAFLVIRMLLPPLKRLLSYLVKSVMGSLFRVSGKAGQPDTLTGIPYLSMLDFMGSNFSSKMLEPVIRWTSLSRAPVTSIPRRFALQKQLGDFVFRLEPRFSVLGMNVRLGFDRFKESWKQMTVGEGPMERMCAIFLGYTVAAMILAIYLNLMTINNARTAGRAVRNAVRQQLLVLKVATFIFIELVTFPLTCGIILDLCSVWLMPDGNFLSRTTFFVQAPLISTFYHWVAGTMFMYTFAVILSSCRRVMRPGAMWFIKDPQDQNSHPIRDILDRPTITQLRKICISGFMYASVVACTVQTAAALLFFGSKSIMPFRWKSREPLSNVPIDLLFLHLILPYTMHYFRPRKALKSIGSVIWRDLASRLRLTSYFFGDRHPAEEHATSWWRVLRPTMVAAPGGGTDGSFKRVPATDYVPLPRDMQATVQVAENGEPTDIAAKELMIRQNIEVARMKRSLEHEFTVVYIPPNFRYRVFFFIAALWLIGAVSFGVAVAVPIQLGRSFFWLFTNREMHDGYSLIVGFYLLWGAYLVAVLIDRLARLRLRRNEGKVGSDGACAAQAGLSLLVAKRGLVWFGKAAYLATCLGVVLPILIALVMDLYLVLPLRFSLDSQLVPKIRIIDMWALGLLYVKIALHVSRLQQPAAPFFGDRRNQNQNENGNRDGNQNPNRARNARVREQQHRIAVGIQHVLASGWTKPDPVQASKEVIGPLVLGLIGMIMVPAIVFKVGTYLLPGLRIDDRALFMQMYPTIFVLFATARSVWVMCGRVASWSQAIRDKEFLVEMRLRNHEPEGTMTPELEGVVVGEQ